MDLRSAFEPPVPTIVMAEGKFGDPEGKTANGIVMHSELFDPVAIIDSDTSGQSPRDVLGRESVPDVPILPDISEALETAPEAEALVLGVSPAGGALPSSWVGGIREAMHAGCDIVSGLHVFLSDDREWTALASECGVRLFDVRKPPKTDDLRVADGRVDDVDATVVLTVGTDCAVGKRTTTFEMYKAAKQEGIDAGWVATGQTGIMVGAHRGTVIDRVPADFTAGVVEQHVVDVADDHEMVFVEGQGALTHRAYSGVTLSIIHGTWPDAVVLVDEPNRVQRALFDQFSVRGVETEKTLVKQLCDAEIAGLSTWGDPATEKARFEIPVANVYESGGARTLLKAVQECVR